MNSAQASHPHLHETPPAGTQTDAAFEVVCAILSALLAPAIAALLEKLKELLAAWRAGTLPPLPEPQPRAPRKHTAPAVRSRPRAYTPRHRTPTPENRPEIMRWRIIFPTPPRVQGVLTRAFHVRPTRHKRRRRC